jgi:hypothetical protein
MILQLKTEQAQDRTRSPRGMHIIRGSLAELLIPRQTNVAWQARALSERFAEADRIKAGALQEAAFYRAKLAAYEAGAAGDVARLERDRTAALERQFVGNG